MQKLGIFYLPFIAREPEIGYGVIKKMDIKAVGFGVIG
jgi:hypothetical protein